MHANFARFSSVELLPFFQTYSGPWHVPDGPGDSSGEADTPLISLKLECGVGESEGDTAAPIRAMRPSKSIAIHVNLLNASNIEHDYSSILGSSHTCMPRPTWGNGPRKKYIRYIYVIDYQTQLSSSNPSPRVTQTVTNHQNHVQTSLWLVCTHLSDRFEGGSVRRTVRHTHISVRHTTQCFGLSVEWVSVEWMRQSELLRYHTLVKDNFTLQLSIKVSNNSSC